MSSMDSPRRQRPLAGVDQALGEGRARQPGELLDQLRERLANLDQNHPSAERWPADSTSSSDNEATAEPFAPPEQPAVPAEVAARADTTRDRPDPDPDSGRPDAGPTADQPSGEQPAASADASPAAGESVQDRSGNAPAADRGRELGQSEIGPDRGRSPGSGDPYRPWFASDEPITPWFAE